MNIHTHNPSVRNALLAAVRMPLLPHHIEGEPFNIKRSKVVDWLCAQPEVRQQVFNFYKNSGAIQYYKGRWRGANTIIE